MNSAIIERSIGTSTVSARDLRNVIDKLNTLGALGLAIQLIEGPEGDFVAHTNGRDVTFGRGYFALGESQRHFVLMHEIFHVALAHPARGKKLRASDATYNHHLFNVACDALINNALGALNSLSEPSGVIRMADVAKLIGRDIGTWSCEQIYFALKTLETEAIEKIVALAADIDDPGADRPGGSDRCDDEMTARWNRRMNAAVGNHPKVAERLRGDIPTNASVSWKTVLRSFFGRAIGGSTLRNDLRRPHRRWSAMEPSFRAAKTPMPFICAQRPGPRPRVAVCVDTSGSIDNEILGAFTAEISDILERAKADVLLIVCDAKVHQMIELSGRAGIAQLRALTYQGGGGTDFAPAIAAANTWKPNALVYLTDLCGPAGPPPSFPVLWAVPLDQGPVNPPFGSLVRLTS